MTFFISSLEGVGGPYICHSHLLQHTSSTPRFPQESSSVHDWDNSPPILHSADEDGLLQKSLSFSADEEEELVGDCDGNELSCMALLFLFYYYYK